MRSLPPTLIALLLVLCAAIGSALAVSALAGSPPSSAFALPTVRPVPSVPPVSGRAIITGPLDGQPTRRERATRRPIAAVVDNLVDARPQSGLSRASLVFEAPVEGSITRLMPVFLEHDAAAVGPVRSARPYFLDWAAPYHPLFVHDGGSPAAEQLTARLDSLTNVDARASGTTFHRRPGRQAPHNLYTGTSAIRTLSRVRSWASSEQTPVLLHGHAGTADGSAKGKSVTVRFSAAGLSVNADYTVTYRYDPASGAYLRSVGGAPAVDSLAGTQIKADNVVVLTTSIRPIANDPLFRVSIRTLGRGKAIILRDGHELSGTWSKPSRISPLRLLDASEQPVRLKPGTTWIEVTSPGSVHLG